MSGKVFFASDLHLGHENIMKFGQRKFDTIEEHDQMIIDNWNSVVRKKDDLVWVLGDVAMTMDGLLRLGTANGRKKLILGNHDTLPTAAYSAVFESLHGAVGKYDGFMMTHIPLHPREMVYRKYRYNIHGHLHMYDIDDPRYINVNYDRELSGLKPISLEQLREHIKTLPEVPSCL